MRLIPSILAVACLCSLPLQGLAASSPYGNRDMEAEIDLSNAHLLPAVYAMDLTMAREGDTMHGTFTLLNNDTVLMGGMQYSMETWSMDGETLFDRVAVREPVALHGKEKQTIAFSYPIPALPAGAYRFRIQVMTQNGRALGWADAGFAGGNATSFVTLANAAYTLPGLDTSIVDPLTGPNTDPGTEIVLHVTAKNDGAASVTATPVLDTFIFDPARGEPVAVRFPAVTLKAGEEKTLDLPFTTPLKPEIYLAQLRLTDAAGKTLSPLAQYRTVVRGADADVLTPRVLTMASKKDTMMRVQLDVVGPGDAELKIMGHTKLELLDAQGTVAEMQTPLLELSDAIQSGIADLILTRDLGDGAALRTTVTAADGTVLDVQTTGIRTNGPAADAALSMTQTFTGLPVLLALLLACSAALSALLAVRMRGVRMHASGALA